MRKENRRTKRLGILSDKEHELLKRAKNRDQLLEERDRLKSKPGNSEGDRLEITKKNKELYEISTRLSELVKNLDKRIIALGTDLRVILKSGSLAPFVRTRAKIFFNIPPIYEGHIDSYSAITAFSELNSPKFSEYDGTEAIPDYSSWKVEIIKKKDRRYWLNTNVEPKLTIEDIFRPDYSIKGIKGTWKRAKDKSGKKTMETINVRDLLKSALELEKKFQTRIKNSELPLILPKSKEDAQNINQIIKNIEIFEKIKESINSTIEVRPITKKDNKTASIEEKFEEVLDFLRTNLTIEEKKYWIKRLEINGL